jgi:predicted nucleic acid-binding Zn ribbon protein
MPTYEFRNKQTGEVTEQWMKMSEKDAFLANNPHLEQTMTKAPAFAGDHITIKKDTGFKEVLQKIHERTPGSQLDKTSSQL